jgi:hypothetical protein
MTNKQFFQEALLEAKAIRETALASAKASLEEAFTPRIKSMIDAKLSLMEDDAMDNNEIGETKEVEEAKAKAEEAKKVEEKKDMEEAKDMDEAKVDETKDMEEGADMDENAELDEMELDEILAELERADANEGVAPRNSPNAEFCNEIINWNFQRTGVLKYENIRHSRVIFSTIFNKNKMNLFK